MEDRMRKSLVKIAVVTGLHLKFDLMPPLIVFSLIHWVYGRQSHYQGNFR